MALSISAAVLLGIIVFVLVKGGYVRVGSALTCTLFGLTLAATGPAPAISSGLAPLARLISSFRPTPRSTAGRACS
ncbi:membrane protein [Streptomyces thermolineatus]|uniref:Membrane protein n=1 Tax=Streptomyces thermolineatus TaxID=44033 RepID=A0ABN3MFX7_9ACTN